MLQTNIERGAERVYMGPHRSHACRDGEVVERDMIALCADYALRTTVAPVLYVRSLSGKWAPQLAPVSASR